MRAALALTAALALSACATTPPVNSLPAVEVAASGETVPVGTGGGEDAADDPAIWRNPEAPENSFIVATDKKAGLHVYTLDGQSVHFDPAGQLNNVDLADLGETGVIVAASDRNTPTDARIRLYRLDKASGALDPLGTVPGGKGEAYGICLGVRGTALHAFSVLKNGAVEEYRIEGLSPGEEPRSVPVVTRQLASQPEGCVVDPRDGTLYVGEETRGIWRFADGSDQGELVALTDGKQLVADVEGLAILPEGEEGGLLVASSQGDNAYTVYRLPGMEYVNRFRIGAGAFGATQETDGIGLHGGSFGPSYPEGLFVAQDGDNRPFAQNFKLVSWKAIREALGL